MSFKIRHEKEDAQEVNRHLHKLSPSIKTKDEKEKFKAKVAKKEERQKKIPRTKKRWF